VDLAAIRASRLAVLCDAMHGAAGSLLPEVLAGGAARGEAFRASRDPLFGGVHPEPIAANLGAAADRVRSEGLDLAVANDGDADRLGVLDRRGEFVSPHRILALLSSMRSDGAASRGESRRPSRLPFSSTAWPRLSARGSTRLRSASSTSPERMVREKSPPEAKRAADMRSAFTCRSATASSRRSSCSRAWPFRAGISIARSKSFRASSDLRLRRRDVYFPVSVIQAFLEEVRADAPARVAGETVTDVRDLDGVKYVFGDAGWLLHRLSGPSR
jgi:hypothetical protein